MTAPRISRDQLVSRVHTQVQKEAEALAGKGGVLSKPEQEQMKDWTVLRDAAQAMRREGKVVRVDAWVDAAVARVAGAVDAVDKPGKGHGTISRAEAREAVASKGDAGARIGRVFELLSGQKLAAKGNVKPALQSAVGALLAAQALEVLSGVKDAAPSAWVASKIEDALAKHTDSGATVLGRLKVGEDTVYVATAARWGRNKIDETVAFFDNEGRLAGSALIERDDNTFALQMRALNADGTRGAVLASAPAAAPAPSDPTWVTALKAEVERKYGNGDDLGVRIKASDLPNKDLRAMYAFLQRNTADGTGLEVISFQGKRAYAFHDYSCVSSVQVFSEGGELLCSVVS